MITQNLSLIKPDIDNEIYQTLLDLADNFQKIDDVAEIFLDNPPTNGYWKVNRKIYKKTPSVGDHIGWVNVREGMSAPIWTNLTLYSVGDLVVPTNDNGHYYECIQTGRSGINEPIFPVSSSETIKDINGKTTWQSSKNYNVNDIVIPSVDNGYFYVCTVSGISGPIEPTWSLVDGDTTEDNVVIWTGYRIVTWKEKGTAANFRPFGMIE